MPFDLFYFLLIALVIPIHFYKDVKGTTQTVTVIMIAKIETETRDFLCYFNCLGWNLALVHFIIA